MKTQHFIHPFLFFIGICAYAQVGVQTKNPRATLDVVGKATDVTKPDGLIVPQMSRAQLTAKALAYSTPQKGAIIYVTVSGPSDGDNVDPRVDVTQTGFYYLDDNLKWKPLSGNAENTLYTADGTLTSNRTVTLGSNILRFVIPTSIENAFSIRASNSTNKNLFSIDALNNRVGFGIFQNVTPRYDITLDGEANKTIGMDQSQSAFSSGKNLTIRAGKATIEASNDENGGDLILRSGESNGSGSSLISFATAPSGTPGAGGGNSVATRMTILGSGNVGIGTITPAHELHVVGNARVSQHLQVGNNLSIGTDTTPVYDLSLDGTTAQTIGVDPRTLTTDAGSDLTINAGNTLAGGTANSLAGGTLVLASGQSRGTQASNIEFKTATPAGANGTVLNTLSTKMTIDGNGSVGVGGTPNANADLALQSTNKGFLLNRVLLTSTSDATTVGAHTAGMMVYNTAFVSDVVPGLYYNDGTRWFNIFGSTYDTFWLLGGSYITAALHFIGTTNTQPLVIRTNNFEEVRILSNQNIGINTTTPGNKLQVTSGVAGESGVRTSLVSAKFIGTTASGTIVSVSPATFDTGSIKYSLQSNDHQGWIILDGRATNSLNAAQQAVILTTLGISGASPIPDADDKYLSQVSAGSLGQTSGNAGNDILLGQSSLPNITLTAETLGAFANGTQNPAAGNVGNGGFGLVKRSVGILNETNDGVVDNTPGEINIVNRTLLQNHFHRYTTESINGGVTQAEVDIKPRTLKVNVFMYVGL